MAAAAAALCSGAGHSYNGGNVPRRALRTLMVAAALLGAAGETVADGAARQDMAALERTVLQYLQVQTAGLPGKTSFSSGAIDARLVLSPCPAPEAFLPPGARLWGNST